MASKDVFVGGGEISIIGVVCARVAMINVGFLCGSSLLNPIQTQRFSEGFDAKSSIATGARARERERERGPND